MEIAAAAFDLDGTLYPNRSLNIRLIPFILKDWRLLWAFGRARGIIRAEQKKREGQPAGDFYEQQARAAAKILGADPAAAGEKIDRLIYRRWGLLFKNIKLFPHARETISALRDAGIKTALLSDFPPETKLEYLGISGFWDAVLCSERCGALKPDPCSFEALAAALGLPPEKILYVGNSYRYDVLGARRIGMRTAWIIPPLYFRRKPAPDFIFRDYRQLRDFILHSK